MENKFTKNSLINILKSISTTIFPFISFAYASRILLADKLGEINFCNSIVSYFSLFAALGISTYGIRECSKVRNDTNKLNETASQLFSLNSISTVLSYVTLFIIINVFPNLENYKSLILIQSLSIFITTLSTDWLFTVFEEFKFMTIRTVVFQILSFVLLLMFVKKPEDYLVYAMISVLSSAGSGVINVLNRRHLCHIRLTFKIDWRKHLKPILFMFSLLITQTIYCNSDMTMLGLMKSTTDVGMYTVSVNIYTMANTIVSALAYVVLPTLSQCFAKHNWDSINKILRYALKLIILLGLPIIIGLNCIAENIVLSIGGNQYLGSVLALRILTVSLLFSYIGGFISNMILIPSGKEIICLKASIISALTNVLFNLLLIPIYGIYAAATTTAISELISLIIISKHVDDKINLNVDKDLFLSPIIGSFAIMVFCLIIKTLIKNSIIICIISIFGSFIIYFAIMLLRKEEIVMKFIRE